MPSNEMPSGPPTPPPLGAAALPAGTYDGSVVLVTGGGTGLGAAIATEFARLGAHLLVASPTPDHLAPAPGRLRGGLLGGHEGGPGLAAGAPSARERQEKCSLPDLASADRPIRHTSWSPLTEGARGSGAIGPWPWAGHGP